MTTGTKGAKTPWEQKLHDAGGRVEEDLKRLVKYINDEVVPDVRRNGSEALRAAATELHRLAERMDDTPGPHPTAGPAGEKTSPGKTSPGKTSPEETRR